MKKNMKIAIIAITKCGAELAEVLKNKMQDAELYTLSKYANAGQKPFEKVSLLTAEIWNCYDGLIFLCASGIAVRSIAPLVSSKYTDPAVVVCPDRGAFAISLLSGHEGGANALTEKVANIIDAMPVITTASQAVPKILPRNLFLGIGCKRGTQAEKLYETVSKVFAENMLSLFRLYTICSIDIKKNEEGLLLLSKKLNVPLQFFSASELNNVSGDFESSDFVLANTGTDNVCGRSAVLGASLANADGRYELIVQKTILDGITVAVAQLQP